MSPIIELLDRVAEQLKPLQDQDLLHVLIRANDRQPVGFQELQLVYVGSQPTSTYNNAVEQQVSLELYLVTQELYAFPRGAYALISMIVDSLKGFVPFPDYSPMIYLGDRKQSFDEAQQILGFVLSYQVTLPPYSGDHQCQHQT